MSRSTSWAEGIDKLAVRYEANLHIACINEWL